MRLRHLLRSRRRGIALLVLITCSARAEPFSRFGLCVAPTPPACAHQSLERSRDQRECSAITDFYIKSVFAYRACLSMEMERAVREANETLAALKCATGQRNCATPRGTSPSAEPRQDGM
jgi:hypothetical protein